MFTSFLFVNFAKIRIDYNNNIQNAVAYARLFHTCNQTAVVVSTHVCMQPKFKCTLSCTYMHTYVSQHFAYDCYFCYTLYISIICCT